MIFRKVVAYLYKIVRVAQQQLSRSGTGWKALYSLLPFRSIVAFANGDEVMRIHVEWPTRSRASRSILGYGLISIGGRGGSGKLRRSSSLLALLIAGLQANPCASAHAMEVVLAPPAPFEESTDIPVVELSPMSLSIPAIGQFKKTLLDRGINFHVKRDRGAGMFSFAGWKRLEWG